MSSLAVFMVLAGGTAVAAGTITGEDIVDQTITGADIAPQNLGADQIRDGSLSGQDIMESGIYSSDIADGSLYGADVATATLSGRVLADGAVGSTKLADGGVYSADVRDDGLTGADIYESSLARVPAAAKAPVEGHTYKTAVASGQRSLTYTNALNENITTYIQDVIVSCPTGTKLIGGGAATEQQPGYEDSTESDWAVLYRDGPDPAAPTTRWRARARNDRRSSFWQLRAWALCAKAG